MTDYPGFDTTPNNDPTTAGATQRQPIMNGVVNRFRHRLAQEVQASGGWGPSVYKALRDQNNRNRSQRNGSGGRWDIHGAIGESLAYIHPAAPAIYEGLRWAVTPTRTTNVNSLYKEQNLYGGVQRDSMPTERIRVRPVGNPSFSESERLRERSMLDYEELAGIGQTQASSGSPATTSLPMYTMNSDPMERMHRNQQSEMDPLFLRNTDQGVPINPVSFNPHQRATYGL